MTGKTVDGKDFTRVDEYSGPGALRSGAPCADEGYRFPTPLQRVTFPIAPGQRASKWVDVINEPGGNKGQINYGFRTRSWEQQTVPAGNFDAIRIDTTMVLDDSTPFRYATNCNFSYWYSPAVRGTVREQRWAQYIQIGDIQGTDARAEHVLRARELHARESDRWRPCRSRGKWQYLRASRSGIRPWGGPAGSLEYLRASRSGIRPWGGPVGLMRSAAGSP